MSMFQQAWRGIIRPPQIKNRKIFLKQQRNQDQKIKRIQLNAINRNGKRIEGYIYVCLNNQIQQTILYLHGNGGCKNEALPLVQLMQQFQFNFAAFDFLGCGNSDPEYLSYGVNQVYDIRDMIQQIKKVINTPRIILWGRSMGCLCSIMFADLYAYEVHALILDSPFRSLSDVIDRIASRRTKIPNIFLKMFLYFVKAKAVQELKIDIFHIDYLSIFKKLTPHLHVLFIFSNFDTIVPASEVFQFYNSYTGPKDLCQIFQTHDQDRPNDLFRQALLWLSNNNRPLSYMIGMHQARQQLYSQFKQRKLQFKQQQRDKCLSNYRKY